MSIILDALKKAEKARSQSDKNQDSSPEGSFVTDSQKSSFFRLEKKKPVVLLALALGVFIFFVYFSFIRKPAGPPVPKPTAAVSQKNTPQVKQQKIENPDTVRQEALSAFQQGDLNASQAHWERLTLLRPTDAEVYNNLGVVLKKMGNKQKARQTYRKALGLNPNYPEALNNLGVLLMEEQQNVEAQSLFNKAIQLKPGYGEAFFHLALLSEREGNYKQAINNYENFLKLSPDVDEKLQGQVEIRIAVLKADSKRVR